MKKITLILTLFFFSYSPFAQQAVPAGQLITAALSKAKLENKKIFVKYSASWCVWCKRLDASMDDTTCKKFFEDNFVIVELDGSERGDLKKLENPGAAAYRTRFFNDEIKSIPFWFILDSNENLIADCYIRKPGQPETEKGRNMACPATEEEVAAFIRILKNTTRLKENELAIIGKRFRQNDISQ